MKPAHQQLELFTVAPAVDRVAEPVLMMPTVVEVEAPGPLTEMPPSSVESPEPSMPAAFDNQAAVAALWKVMQQLGWANRKESFAQRAACPNPLVYVGEARRLRDEAREEFIRLRGAGHLLDKKVYELDPEEAAALLRLRREFAVFSQTGPTAVRARKQAIRDAQRAA